MWAHPDNVAALGEEWQPLTEAEAEAEAVKVRQAAMIEQLKALRDAYEFGTVTTPQGKLQIDERSQGRLNRALEVGRNYEKLTGQPFSTAWRMYDNSWAAPITVAILEGWSLLIGGQVQHVFSHYGVLYAQVMSAQTLAELDGIDLREGWDVGASA